MLEFEIIALASEKSLYNGAANVNSCLLVALSLLLP
jgi:hypothetical protein